MKFELHNSQSHVEPDVSERSHDDRIVAWPRELEPVEFNLEKAGEGIRTPDVQLGRLTLYH